MLYPLGNPTHHRLDSDIAFGILFVCCGTFQIVKGSTIEVFSGFDCIQLHSTEEVEFEWDLFIQPLIVFWHRWRFSPRGEVMHLGWHSSSGVSRDSAVGAPAGGAIYLSPLLWVMLPSMQVKMWTKPYKTQPQTPLQGCGMILAWAR